MRFADVGQQLRAYRLESGLRAEEIAARLGVSRAALYRYEKGEVIKLDTIRRLAELLQISPLSLLGIGVEYFSRPLALQERLRQVEENALERFPHRKPQNPEDQVDNENRGKGRVAEVGRIEHLLDIRESGQRDACTWRNEGERSEQRLDHQDQRWRKRQEEDENGDRIA